MDTPHGLPFLPGNSFRDPTKTQFHLSQTLDYKNGYTIPRVPLSAGQISQAEMDELANKLPTLTYGQAKPSPPVDFIPAHVAFDKKVLKFDAYFKETVPQSPAEQSRIRPVTLYYYLEDDSIAIMEPQIENSGIPQGKLIKRQRLPKNERGDHYHWKDLNVAMSIIVYGKVFRITDCDKFTKDFMEREGIELNHPEQTPVDPYTEQRKEPQRIFVSPSDFDRLRQFLTMDRKVLRFFAIWDDTSSMYGESRLFIIHYYLVDDTVEIREVQQVNSGRDPFPVLLRRQHLPKTKYIVDKNFPACVLEVTDQEVKEWFSPMDFIVGQKVTILGRHFLLYDCDKYTREYYQENLGIHDFQSIDVSKKQLDEFKKEIPPYNGFGILEDSLQNCLTLIPKPPRKDVIKMLENDHKVLRYEAILDSINPEDKRRRFIISFFLSSDMISIYEPPIRNSGIRGGKFLEKAKVLKPGSTIGNPQYYGPQDFAIGSIVEVFGNKFVITNADLYVLKYAEANASHFPLTTLNSLRDGIRTQCSGSQEEKRIVRVTKDQIEILAQLVKEELMKQNYQKNVGLQKALIQEDKANTKTLPKEKFIALCEEFDIPVHDITIAKLIFLCTYEDKINYDAFLKALNF
ncbi:EF-hand domain-containing protein 1 [Protopterus annectens]|uniref:EF-hand domain-containing protein 1 n=1 Tax=Protopterus annectens TaxID=7888 RepID=UPI001CFBE760|nr:EF-hand domain-containing protein 1 [Protopterus annectens]